MQVSGNMAVVRPQRSRWLARGFCLDQRERDRCGATYTVATNDFLARGGDGYSMFAGADVVLSADASQLMASHVVDYIRENGISEGPQGRISFQ